MSGDVYREVIAIWETYRRAVSIARTSRPPVQSGEDLPDVLPDQLQPEGARLVVLAMRTELRNLRRQAVLLRALTPEKLVRNWRPDQVDQAKPPPILRKDEAAILAGFLDPTETSSRGGEWDEIGRLIIDGEPRSRPGLQQIISKVLEASRPPPPEGDTGRKRKRK